MVRVGVCWLVCLIGCLFVGFVCVCVRVCVDSACKRLFASFLIVCVRWLFDLSVRLLLRSCVGLLAGVFANVPASCFICVCVLV